MRKKHTARQNTLFGSILCGAGVTFFFGMIALLILAGVARESGDPEKYLSPFSSVLLVMIALLAGFSSARFYRKNGILIGFLSGLCFLLIGGCISLALPGEGTVSGRVLLLPLFLVLSTLGGVLGGAKRVRRRHR